eukprot:NODE_140_length_17926_cov_0.139620.p14 type:complete len:128 gc:universal NODE_140_length_17926_cov_0.139620:102-485(+)
MISTPLLGPCLPRPYNTLTWVAFMITLRADSTDTQLIGLGWFLTLKKCSLLKHNCWNYTLQLFLLVCPRTRKMQVFSSIQHWTYTSTLARTSNHHWVVILLLKMQIARCSWVVLKLKVPLLSGQMTN